MVQYIHSNTDPKRRILLTYHSRTVRERGDFVTFERDGVQYVKQVHYIHSIEVIDLDENNTARVTLFTSGEIISIFEGIRGITEEEPELMPVTEIF